MKFRPWHYKRFHPSYGIGWACVGMMLGLDAGQIITMPYAAAMTVVCIVVIVLALRRLRWYGCVVIVLCGFGIGAVRGSDFKTSLAGLSQAVGSTHTISGIVSEDPSTSRRGDTRLVVSRVELNKKEQPGALWVTLRGQHREIKRGDHVVLNALFKPGFGPYQASLSYPTIIAHQPAHDPVVALRDRFAEALRRVIIEPSASLGLGFVIGQRSELPQKLDDELRMVGLTHIVVASGYNLMILIRFAKRIFEKHSKFLVMATSVFLMLGFLVVSGASPSMTRAAIVAGLSLLAWWYGRRFHPLLLIMYVAALSGMISPLYVWADLGWWLSFLAFFGVLIVGPLMTRMLYRGDRQPSSGVQIIMESVAAQLMTLPIILLAFGNLPVLAIIANLVTAPIIPVAMAITFLCGVIAMIVPATVIGIPAEIILSYFVAVTNFLSSPSWSQQQVTISWQFMLMLYSLIAVAMLLIWRHWRVNLRGSSTIE